jgi:glycosyltransferase involved in cell wall biosynthesis
MARIRVTRIVARLNIGGPAVHIANLMAGLDPARFESHLITGRPGPSEGDMGYLIEQKGLAPPTVLPTLGRSLNPLRDLQTALKLVSILRHQQPHIVETHTAKAGVVGRVAALLAGVPVLLHVFHGHVFYGYFGALQTRLFIGIERFLARRTDRMIAISPTQRHDIAHVYRVAPPDKVVVVPLGLDLRPFAAVSPADRSAGFAVPIDEPESRVRTQRPTPNARVALGLPQRGPLVGYVGRLTAVKNPALFVSTAQRVLQSLPDVHFVLVGDGELRADVERQIAALGLSDRVTLAGWHRDMPPIYAAMDVLVLSSLNEGTPVTAIEAMAAAVPVVATAVGGMPDLVTNGQTGLLAPPGDAQALADRVIGLLRDPKQARVLARAARQDVLARFGVERLVCDMESLYVTLLAENDVQV